MKNVWSKRFGHKSEMPFKRFAEGRKMYLDMRVEKRIARRMSHVFPWVSFFVPGYKKRMCGQSINKFAFALGLHYLCRQLINYIKELEIWQTVKKSY